MSTLHNLVMYSLSFGLMAVIFGTVLGLAFWRRRPNQGPHCLTLLNLSPIGDITRSPHLFAFEAIVARRGQECWQF